MMRNTAAPPWPCSGFITNRAMLVAERIDLVEIARDQGRRHQVRKSITNIFSGALRTLAGSLTTSVLGWMRCRKCVEVM